MNRLQYWWQRRKDSKVGETIHERIRFAVGGMWGDAINWQDVERGCVVGWKRQHPKVGDLLKSSMQSGKTGVFRFRSVEPQENPRDMFFGHVDFVGFLESTDQAS